jgi:hypothetical protein
VLSVLDLVERCLCGTSGVLEEGLSGEKEPYVCSGGRGVGVKVVCESRSTIILLAFSRNET